jgi:hypothetical protein
MGSAPSTEKGITGIYYILTYTHGLTPQNSSSPQVFDSLYSANAFIASCQSGTSAFTSEGPSSSLINRGIVDIGNPLCPTSMDYERRDDGRGGEYYMNHITWVMNGRKFGMTAVKKLLKECEVVRDEDGVLNWYMNGVPPGVSGAR